MIKDDFLTNVISVIDKHERFEHIDFKIDIEKDTLRIIYIIEPKYYIVFKDKKYFKDKKADEHHDILGDASPGKFSLHEEFSLNRKSEVYIKINEWLEILWRDISLSSPLAILEEEQEHIDKVCAKFDTIGEGYFTTEEILEIRDRMESAKDEFIREICNMVDDEKERKFEIEKLERDIKTLQQTMPYLKKKGWIRSFTGRVYHNTRRLLELRQKSILNKM